MDERTQLVLFLNLHNLVVLHGLVVDHPPSSLLQFESFASKSRYDVGGLRFSIMEIEHAVLRAASSPPLIWGTPALSLPNPKAFLSGGQLHLGRGTRGSRSPFVRLTHVSISRCGGALGAVLVCDCTPVIALTSSFTTPQWSTVQAMCTGGGLRFSSRTGAIFGILAQVIAPAPALR